MNAGIVEEVGDILKDAKYVEAAISEREDAPIYGTVPTYEKKEVIVDMTLSVSDSDVDLLSVVTMAEAEGECEYGKRLVIDTVLNRVDSEYFPDTIQDVIYQKYHFTSMWNGRTEECYVKEDIKRLVEEEIRNRTNWDVIYFTADEYGNYGIPMFPVGNHYFSSYN